MNRRADFLEFNAGVRRARAAYTADAKPGEPSYIPPPLPPRLCKECGKPAAKVGLLCPRHLRVANAAAVKRHRAKKDKP